MNERIKESLTIASVLYAISTMLIELADLIKAYATPEKAITVYYNYYGEANAEMILVPIMTIIATITLLWVLKKTLKEKR